MGSQRVGHDWATELYWRNPDFKTKMESRGKDGPIASCAFGLAEHKLWIWLVAPRKQMRRKTKTVSWRNDWFALRKPVGEASGHNLDFWSYWGSKRSGTWSMSRSFSSASNFLTMTSPAWLRKGYLQHLLCFSLPNLKTRVYGPKDFFLSTGGSLVICME